MPTLNKLRITGNPVTSDGTPCQAIDFTMENLPKPLPKIREAIEYTFGAYGKEGTYGKYCRKQCDDYKKIESGSYHFEIDGGNIRGVSTIDNLYFPQDYSEQDIVDAIKQACGMAPKPNPALDHVVDKKSTSSALLAAQMSQTLHDGNSQINPPQHKSIADEEFLKDLFRMK